MSTVQAISVTVGPDDKPVCTPDPVCVSTADTLLSFNLLTPGWAFPDTGAVVVSRPSPSFPQPSTTVSPVLATLLDLKLSNGDVPYRVTVVHVASGRRRSHDPTIRNEN